MDPTGNACETKGELYAKLRQEGTPAYVAYQQSFGKDPLKPDLSFTDLMSSEDRVRYNKWVDSNTTNRTIEGNSYDINLLERTQPYTYADNVGRIREAIEIGGANAVPPIEIRVDHGRVFVVDGHHRLKAFEQLGYDRVPIKYLHSTQLGKVFSDGSYYRSLQEIITAADLCK